MPTATMLDQATSMIEKAWGQPVEILEALAVRRPIEDPLLRSAMSAHAGLAITENSVSAHQKRLHALTRPGYVPTFYELPQITSSAADLRLAHAEGRTRLQEIRRLVEAREGVMPPGQAPAARRQAQAAVARSGHAPQSPAQVPEQPGPAPVAGLPAPGAGPRR